MLATWLIASRALRAIVRLYRFIALALALVAGSARAASLLPPATSTTNWSVASDHKSILLSVNHRRPERFIIKGVDYSPRPINDAALAGPGSDYFWGDPAHLTYELLWTRDLWGSTYNDARLDLPDGLVRQLGANSIRTYAWWKWIPRVPADYARWKTLDWSVGPHVSFGDTHARPGFAAWPAHDGGDQFLDLCWNNGVDPIYVVIGISVDPWLGFPSTNPDSRAWHDQQMFLAKTTEWLSKRYGYHPAVLGFAIGNETNLPYPRGTDRYLEYWKYLNSLGAIAKRFAPGKLTTTAFADYPSGQPPMLLKQLITFKDAANAKPGAPTLPVCVDFNGDRPGIDCASAHRRAAYPADVYSLDVWGFNAYRKPESEDTANFKHWIVDGYYTGGLKHDRAAPNPVPRPMILTEWGAPASIRAREGQPPQPPNSEWVHVGPGTPGEFHGATGYRTARLIEQIGTGIYGPRSTISTAGGGVLSGGYIFELQDEWWKEAQHDHATWSSHDTTVQTSTFPFGEPGSGYSSFWDEEWFGLMSAKANPGRIQRCEHDVNGHAGVCSGKLVGSGAGAPDDPVLTSADDQGWLNGGADELTPRAAFFALQSIFRGDNSTRIAHGQTIPTVASRVTCPASPTVFCKVLATNSPTQFAVEGLPAGLQLDSRQGIIFGTYAKAGDFSIRVVARNDAGKSAETVVLVDRAQSAQAAIASGLHHPDVKPVAFKLNHHP